MYRNIDKLKRIEEVKSAVIKALSHQEAEDGLFLWNFSRLHEEDERPKVNTTKEKLLSALNELIQEGRIQVCEEVESVVFKLQPESSQVLKAMNG